MIKSTSPLWVIIPIKSLARAKSRLTAVISMDERQSLSVMLLEKSLRMLQPLPNIRVVVISCDENARAAAEKWDAEVYCNSQDVSLNTALSAGYDYVRRIGGRRILILPADLPFVSAESIRDICGADRAVGICPDRHLDGTNGLYLRDVPGFRFQYGFNSFVKHLAEAKRNGVRPQIIFSEGLRFDLDTPNDWRIYQDRLKNR